MIKEDTPLKVPILKEGGSYIMYDVLNIVIIFSGIYLIYSSISMKVKGEIIANVVLNKSTSENAIKDKEGFINFIYGKLLAIGIIIVLSGVVDYINDSMQGSSIVRVITFLVFAAALVVYSVVAKKAINKFT